MYHFPRFRFTLLAFSCLFFANSASAAHYVGEASNDYGNVMYRFTTDGTIGAINEDNILSWSIMMNSRKLGEGDLVKGNKSSIRHSKITRISRLVATPTHLYFQPIDDMEYQLRRIGLAIRANQGTQAGARFFIFYIGYPPPLPSDLGGIEFNPNIFAQSGTVISFNNRLPIAELRASGAVPEPKTWTLLLSAFFLVGMTLRFRQTHSRFKYHDDMSILNTGAPA